MVLFTDQFDQNKVVENEIELKLSWVELQTQLLQNSAKFYEKKEGYGDYVTSLYITLNIYK